jgi:hypothetical protein
VVSGWLGIAVGCLRLFFCSLFFVCCLLFIAGLHFYGCHIDGMQWRLPRGLVFWWLVVVAAGVE